MLYVVMFILILAPNIQEQIANTLIVLSGFLLLMSFILYIPAVSYTHLDVYKRQLSNRRYSLDGAKERMEGFEKYCYGEENP